MLTLIIATSQIEWIVKMNFSDQIAKSIILNSEQWEIIGHNHIKNRQIVVEAYNLGNVTLDLIWPFNQTGTSIMKLKIDGILTDTTSSEKKKIEKAFFAKMRKHKIKGA